MPAAPPAFKVLACKAAGTMLLQLDAAVSREATVSVQEMRAASQQPMSDVAAHLRVPTGMQALAEAEWARLADFWQTAAARPAALPALLKNRDLLITRTAVLHAMLTAAKTVGSCGAALVLDEEGEQLGDALPHLRYAPARPLLDNCRLITHWQVDGCRSTYQPVRPLPAPDGWFETVWDAYRQRMQGVKTE